MQPRLTATALRPAARLLRWQALVSMLLAVVLMVASLHCLSCTDNGATGGPVASTTAGIDISTSPFDADCCLSGHCHCVCHGFAQASTQPDWSLSPFAEAKFGVHEDRLPPTAAGNQPFKPPRA
jgi:hypothetical protein